MSRTDEKRLDDIRDMCAKVASLVERGRAEIEKEELLWLALEQAIEVAGEAASRVSEATIAAGGPSGERPAGYTHPRHQRTGRSAVPDVA